MWLNSGHKTLLGVVLIYCGFDLLNKSSFTQNEF